MLKYRKLKFFMEIIETRALNSFKLPAKIQINCLKSRLNILE